MIHPTSSYIGATLAVALDTALFGYRFTITIEKAVRPATISKLCAPGDALTAHGHRMWTTRVEATATRSVKHCTCFWFICQDIYTTIQGCTKTRQKAGGCVPTVATKKVKLKGVRATRQLQMRLLHGR